MSKRRITITVDADIDEWLETGSRTYGRSMSELVRISLREFRQAQPHRFSTADKARSKSEDAWMFKQCEA